MKQRKNSFKRLLRRPFEWLGIGLGWLVFAHVSHRMLFRICDFIAAIGYRFDRKGRELSRENLRLVVGEEHLTPRREELILKRSYRNMVRTLGHVFWTSRNARARAAATGEFTPKCVEFLAANKPAITVSCHMGCWELLSQLVFLQGRKIVSVAKDIGTPGMTELLMKSRRSLGQTIVRAEGALHPLLQGLQEGADVGLLVDQVVKPDQGGVWVRYFGRPVPVSAAPAFLQAKTHAPIVIAWSRPLRDGRYRCEYIAEFLWKKGMDIWGRTQDCISALERTIRRHPSCWVMNYRYFRKKPKEKDLAQLATRERRRIALAVVAFVTCAFGAWAGETVSAGFGRDVALKGAGVTFSPTLFKKDWNRCQLKGGWTPGNDGAYGFSILDGDDKIAGVRATVERQGRRAVLAWDFSVRRDYSSSAFCIALSLPTSRFGGGEVRFGKRKFALPATFGGEPWIGNAMCREVWVSDAKGEVFSFTLAEDASVMVQDDRKWGGQHFALRVGIGGSQLKAGERRRIEMTLDTPGGIDRVVGRPFVISRSAEWVPLHDTTDIAPGSALDFSKLGWVDAPAGKHGRVIAKGAHFEFEGKPGVPQRFYGCNLCFTANYLSDDEADALCARLARMGYNALRIHHYESTLCDPKDGTTLLPEKMAQLDGLLNACIKHGIYLTTDLFVSRRVKWRTCGIDRDGTIGMDEFKSLALFDERVFRNYLAFSRNLLCHVNPKTGRRWADEPAFAFLALINEGNLGNHGYAVLASQEAFKKKWRAWLSARRAESPDLYRDITEKIPGNAWEHSRQNCAFTLFLADLESSFAERMTKFVRDEIGSKVLLTDMSCWRNPIAYQLVRTRYDYVDDHFYIDHPQFLEKPWNLPSKCPNANPVRRASMGFEGVARHRLLDRPFTISEFNYSGPGQFRGVGGMVLGAQAALQEYDAIWRFAWSHSHDGVLESKPMTYFDVARDPLQRATERAALTLYMRRDMTPLKRTFAVTIPESKVRTTFGVGPHADINEMWFGWYERFGTWVGNGKPKFANDGAEFPEACSLKADYFKGLASGHRMGDGQVAISRDEGTFVVDTPRTQGFFAESGRHKAGALSARIIGAPAAAWVSALDDAPVARSGRLLLTHVTDVQDEGATYADEEKKVLLKWGKLPHLMRAGRALVSIRLDGNAVPRVYALCADGSRRCEVPSSWDGTTLTFTANTARDASDATFLYEIERPRPDF